MDRPESDHVLSGCLAPGLQFWLWFPRIQPMRTQEHAGTRAGSGDFRMRPGLMTFAAVRR